MICFSCYCYYFSLMLSLNHNVSRTINKFTTTYVYIWPHTQKPLVNKQQNLLGYFYLISLIKHMLESFARGNAIGFDKTVTFLSINRDLKSIKSWYRLHFCDLWPSPMFFMVCQGHFHCNHVMYLKLLYIGTKYAVCKVNRNGDMNNCLEKT